MDQGLVPRIFHSGSISRQKPAGGTLRLMALGMLVALLACASRAQIDSVTRAGIDAFTSGKMNLAASIFRPIHPDSLNETAAYYAGSALSAAGDFDASVRFLRRAHLLRPENTWYLHQLARTYALAGRIAEADTAYRRILTTDSTYTPAISALGQNSFDRKDYAAAAGFFARALQQNRMDFLSNYYYGCSLTNLDMPDSAYPFLVFAQTLNRRHLPTITLLALIHYRRKDYADASRLYEQAERQAPWNAEYWYMDGQCEELLGNRPAAVVCLRNATKLDSTESTYFARLGQVYYALAKYDSALAAFRRAAALEGESPSLLFNVGLALARMDSVKSAATAFEAAANAHHVEKIGAVYRQLGALYFTHNQYRKAEKQYRKAVQSDPLNAEGWFFYAICLDKKGDQKGASAAYRKFMATAKGNPAIQRNWLDSAKKRLEKIGSA